MKKILSAALLGFGLVTAQAFADDTYKIVEGGGLQVSYSTTSSTIHTKFGPYTRAVRVICTSACHIAIGASNSGSPPIADIVTGAYLATGIAENFLVSGGSVISVIQSGAAGVLYVQQLTK